MPLPAGLNIPDQMESKRSLTCAHRPVASIQCRHKLLVHVTMLDLAMTIQPGVETDSEDYRVGRTFFHKGIVHKIESASTI